MESVHFKQDTTSSGFSPKFGSKEKKSNSIEDLLARSRALTAKPTKPKRTYSTAKRTYFATCSTCGKKEEIRAFILPVGWYSFTFKKSGYIMDQRLEQKQFCSKDCLKEHINA